MSFLNSFICSPSMYYCINKEIMQRKHNRNRATVRLTESIIHQAEEMQTPSDQANVIGILGGASSLSFAKKLVDQKGELSLILCIDPDLTNKLLLGSFCCPKRVHTDHMSIVQKLRFKRAVLEKCGVCCIVMPCHVLHFLQEEIEEGCSVPFIHMGDSVVEELKEADLKPVEAGSPLSIGILSTNATLMRSIYEEKLENEGFQVVMPDQNTMKQIVVPAMDALSTKDFEGARNLLRISLYILLVRAVNKIVLASDELRELLPPDDPLWRKCIDPMEALARSAVKYAQSAGRK